ncbi:hypothetical protein BGZ65_009177 [Modicella reniformis]|uniref:F-box domain-containing protein n=1 Tax=Modicella reniformis TaxID=1440133 RepID=A0A9P6MK58_9FUNG|nr:hypothetical protein BGZ65_009177 [Modicella reniformis]
MALDIPEVLMAVAQFLRRGELAQCLCVCKSWRSALLFSLWKNMTIGVGYNRTPAPSPSIESLQLHGHLIHTLMIEDRYPGRFALNYPKIRTLRLYLTHTQIQGTPIGTASVAPPPPPPPPPTTPSSSSSSSSPSTHEIDMARGFWQAVVELPHLKELTVTDTDMIECPEEFSRTCAKVERLRLFRSHIPRTSITAIVDHGLPLIRELRTLPKLGGFGLVWTDASSRIGCLKKFRFPLEEN